MHERLHTGYKSLKSDHCDKTFVQKDDLRVHERLHTGEKPFNCHHCDKKFAQKDKLREHERIHTGKKTPQTSRVRLGMAGPVVRTPAKRQKRSKGTQLSPKPSTSQQQDRPVWDVSPSSSPPRDKLPRYSPPSPPFQGWTPAQMVPEMNRTHYSTDEEEFDLNEGFVEPYSIILKTPIKRKRL